jgi:PAS domain-containing protein
VVTYCHAGAEETFGITREEALCRAVADLIIPERFRDSHSAGLRRALADAVGPMLDRRVEMTAKRNRLPVEMTISTLREGPR